MTEGGATEQKSVASGLDPSGQAQKAAMPQGVRHTGGPKVQLEAEATREL